MASLQRPRQFASTKGNRWHHVPSSADLSQPGDTPRVRLLSLNYSSMKVLTTYCSQVIYPHSDMDMKAFGRTDYDLQKVLDSVRLGYLPEREGGWDTKKDW